MYNLAAKWIVYKGACDEVTGMAAHSNKAGWEGPLHLPLRLLQTLTARVTWAQGRVMCGNTGLPSSGVISNEPWVEGDSPWHRTGDGALLSPRPPGSAWKENRSGGSPNGKVKGTGFCSGQVLELETVPLKLQVTAGINLSTPWLRCQKAFLRPEK